MQHDFDGLLSHGKVIKTEFELIAGRVSSPHFGEREIFFHLHWQSATAKGVSIVAQDTMGLYIKSGHGRVGLDSIGETAGNFLYRITFDEFQGRLDKPNKPHFTNQRLPRTGTISMVTSPVGDSDGRSAHPAV